MLLEQTTTCRESGEAGRPIHNRQLDITMSRGVPWSKRGWMIRFAGTRLTRGVEMPNYPRAGDGRLVAILCGGWAENLLQQRASRRNMVARTLQLSLRWSLVEKRVCAITVLRAVGVLGRPGSPGSPGPSWPSPRAVEALWASSDSHTGQAKHPVAWSACAAGPAGRHQLTFSRVSPRRCRIRQVGRSSRRSGISEDRPPGSHTTTQTDGIDPRLGVGRLSGLRS